MTLNKLSLLLGFAVLLPASAVFAGPFDSYPATDTAIQLAQGYGESGHRGEHRADESPVSGKAVRDLIKNGRGRIDSYENVHRVMRHDDANGFRQRLSEVEQRYMSLRDRHGNLRAHDSDELLAEIRLIDSEANQVAGDPDRRPRGR